MFLYNMYFEVQLIILMEFSLVSSKLVTSPECVLDVIFGNMDILFVNIIICFAYFS